MITYGYTRSWSRCVAHDPEPSGADEDAGTGDTKSRSVAALATGVLTQAVHALTVSPRAKHHHTQVSH